jgi:hypothetical protein
MAGKTILGECRVALRKRARAQHLARQRSGQHRNGGEVRRDKGKHPVPLHRQPQNTKIAAICPAASVAKASVIG